MNAEPALVLPSSILSADPAGLGEPGNLSQSPQVSYVERLPVLVPGHAPGRRYDPGTGSPLVRRRQYGQLCGLLVHLVQAGAVWTGHARWGRHEAGPNNSRRDGDLGSEAGDPTRQLARVACICPQAMPKG